MYIAANIDDCAVIINEFLPLDLFKKISEFDYKTNLSSHKEWEKNLFKDERDNIIMKEVIAINNFASITKKEIKSKEPIFEEFLKILISCPFIPYKENSSIKISYYEYQKFAGINWHNDGSYSLNYSFYIHDEWDMNWGGETLVDTKRGLPLVCTPTPNSLLAIKNGIDHKVCSVVGPKKRKVLQIRGVFLPD